MARAHASCRIAQERLEPRVYLSKAIGPKEASPSQWPDGGLDRFDPLAKPSGNDRFCAGFHWRTMATSRARRLSMAVVPLATAASLTSIRITSRPLVAAT